MRILLSAFACDPTQGSEEGVGWSWAYQLAKAGHEVCVLTRDYHRPAIETRLAQIDMPNLRFEALGVRYVPFWMPGTSVYPYYVCWQWHAYLRARKLHREQPFDIIHHVTYGVFRNASYLFFLNAPFVFGPVGGGERSPRALRVSMSGAGKRFEIMRDIVNVLPYFDPLWRLMLRRTARIVTRTDETRACLPATSRSRAVVSLENMIPDIPYIAGAIGRASPLKLLYAGHLRPLKGMHLAVRAVALARKQAPVELTIVGKGPDECRLKQEVSRLGLKNAVHFVPWIPKSQVLALHATHDAFLFPSLHDSGGTVVLEAIARGRPVICLDLGGPAVTVDEHCARIVRAKSNNESQVVRGLADAILELVRMPGPEWEEMRRAAVRRARFFTPERVISRVYGPLLGSCTGQTARAAGSSETVFAGNP